MKKRVARDGGPLSAARKRLSAPADKDSSSSVELSVRQLVDIIEARYGDPETFLANLRVWLHKYRVTQTELGEEVGLDPTNINRWLNGHINPSLKNMLLMDEGMERIIHRTED